MKGCLLFHGFTGSPYEVQPLANHLQKQTDWLIHVPTLPGHGCHDTLKRVTWRDWLLFAEIEFLRMAKHCSSIYVIGFSMGALIASHIAAKYPVERLVLLSPALFHLNTPQMLEDMKQLVRNYPDDHHSFLDLMQRYKDKITNTPLRAVLQFKKLVKEITPIISNIDTPLFIVQGEKDALVLPKSAHYIYTRVKSKEKELLFLPYSKHVVCHDCQKEEVFQRVEHFLLRGLSVYI